MAPSDRSTEERRLVRACSAVGLLALLALLALAVMMAAPPFTQWSHEGTSMLSVHLALELVAVVVAALIVAVGWHAFEGDGAGAGHVLMAGFLVVGVCDLVHALTYAGMPPLLGPASTPRAIFFWLMGRSAEVATLAALGFGLRLPRRPALVGGIAVAAALVAWGSWTPLAFPTTFVPGQGVTPFKAGYEVALCAANLAVAVLLWRRARAGGRPQYYLLATSAFVVGIGELAFTAYLEPSDFENIFGHLFKLAGYALLYRATFVASMRRPFDALRDSRRRIAEREQQLDAVVGGTLDAIVTVDAGQRIVVFNRAAEALFGLSAEAAMGGPLQRMLPLATADWLDALVASPATADGAGRRVRIEGRHVSGDALPLELSLSSVGRGAQRLTTAMLRDLRPQQAVEASRQAQAAAEAASRAKSAFVAHMSHEIRTPMNAVLGFLQLAQRGDLPGPQRAHLARATLAAQTLLGVIDRILDFSKIEAGRLELAPTRFAVSELLAHVEAIVGVLARQKALDFVVRVAPDVPAWLLGDRQRLAQVLVNLCGNAVKFTQAGQVELSLSAAPADGGRVLLRAAVVDTGIGIAPDQLERLFRPFTQADESTSRRYGGTGLGLAISRQLVELMGGRIAASSTPGAGSAFSVEVPLQAVAAPAAGELADAAHADPADWAPLSGRHVLLVDDNELNQLLASHVLRELAHMRVSVATSGDEALRLLASTPVDLVLLDVELPGMDGFEVARRVRAQPHRPALPIVAMTAHATDEVRRACLAAGMNDYMTKPFDVDALLRTLLRWLPAAPPAVAASSKG
ncbi:MASE3 domain-containing protein [Aquabacterium humicola]|uniref:MASE3 domain-containing protein n=1 Tax=Aquabacterium humicola TaxID=3237377 RepID=UPI0025438688|nr:MASE3 domain-containing protein [Rubrivivax pictus]